MNLGAPPLRLAWLTVIALVCCRVPAAELLVRRDLLAGGAETWSLGAWNSAAGRIGATDDRAPQAAYGAVEFGVRYEGKGFQSGAMAPVGGPIPGRLRRLSVWVKAVQPEYHWLVQFKDAQGRDSVAGKRLDWGLRTEPGQWVRLDFTIPADWAQPVQLAGVAGHNWSRQNAAGEAVLRLGQLQVETDIGGVSDPATLLSLSANTNVPSNLFQPGSPVRYTVVADSWLGRELAGSLAWQVRDSEGRELIGREVAVRLNDVRREVIEWAPPRFGAYTLRLTVSFGAGTALQRTSRFAYTPAPPPRTWAEKVAGPYGLNIHGGQPGLDYRGIARLGFTWVRDYAYNFEWLLRARGEDQRYAGWPYYPKLDQAIQDAGLVLLPCLAGGIGASVKAGRLQPDRQWRSDLLGIVTHFPQYVAWELDNEYDYAHGREEAKRGWASYDGYHRTFAAAVKLVEPKLLTVEQGTAGLHPEWVRRSVGNHSFDGIDVVNGHFYCGVDPPEVATENANVGQEGLPPAMLDDVCRDFVAAARSDGRPRQAWVTEFGWDTLAGHVVSEREQAAYLQRGFALGLQAGLSKMFWYWHRDTKDQPKQFFDGCGLLDPRDEPKPAAAAMAALAHLLPAPTPVGTFEPAPGAMGHVFRCGGQLVACAFRLAPGAQPVTVEFGSGQVYDLYANPLPGRRHELDITPLWIVGLSDADPLYRQTAYRLRSPRLVSATAGDTLTIEPVASNNRSAPIAASLAVRAPDGWTVQPAGAPLQAAPGTEQTAPVSVTIAPQAGAGQHEVTVEVTEGALRRTLTTQVMVAAAADLKVPALTGEPGPQTVAVTVHNRRRRPASYALTATVPRSWRVEPARLTVSDIPAGGSATAQFQVSWTAEWAAGERAQVTVATPAGQVLAQAGLAPGLLTVPRVIGLKMDGDLGDWPAAAKLPDWALGRTGAATRGELWLGYGEAGLYVAGRVAPSTARVTDPRSFWAQDCLELFVDTANHKQPRPAYQVGDHQFWLCPLVDQQRAYLGQWKRGGELAATQFDLPGVSSHAARTADGYLLEALIPAASLKGFVAQAGRKLGLNLNLTVPGARGNGELYWPLPKSERAADQPHRWGIAVLQ